MKKRKAVFFDIDGTIWNRMNEIPQTTIEAVRLMRQAGHLIFLNSGRSRGYIRDPQLFDMGIDGLVSGCGTMIEHDGKVVFYRELDNELVVRTLRILKENGLRTILEGRDHLYMRESEFGQDLYGQKVSREMGGDLRDIDECWGKWSVCKLSCATEGADVDKCMKELEEDYDFIIHDIPVIEMVPKGFGKDDGIRRVCSMLGIDIGDTYAFGDSNNDISMFKAAGTAVAMGNATPDARAAADYVTSDLEDDGIWNACLHLGLIEDRR